MAPIKKYRLPNDHIRKLISEISNVLKKQKEIRKVYLFGSNARSESDRYSDVDLQVITSNFDRTVSSMNKMLKTIGNPAAILPIKNEVNNLALTILWDNYPFYQKTDISFVTNQKNIFDINSKMEVLYSMRNTTFSSSVSKKRYRGFNEKDRHIYDYYVGLTRYVKYRKRNINFLAYKFYKAATESFIKLTYRMVIKQNIQNIGFNEYKNIEEKFSKSDKKFIQKIILVNNYKLMDSNTKLLSKEYLKTLRKNKKLISNPISIKFAKKVVKFVDVELD